MNINFDSAKLTICKNILIFGYCKFEDKGCAFSHKKDLKENKEKEKEKEIGNVMSVDTKKENTDKKFNILTPAFTPVIDRDGEERSGVKEGRADERRFNLLALAFTPEKSDDRRNNGEDRSSRSERFNLLTPAFTPVNEKDTLNKFNLLTPAFTPEIGKLPSVLIAERRNDGARFNVLTPAFTPDEKKFNILTSSDEKKFNILTSSFNPDEKKFNVATPSFTPDEKKFNVSSPLFIPEESKKFNVSTPSFTPGNYTPEYPSPPSSSYVPNNHDFYRQFPLNYHLYSPLPPPRLRMPLKSYETNVNDMFIDNDLRQSLHQKNEATLQNIPNSNLPLKIHIYHTLVPIDKTYTTNSKVHKIPSNIYKCFSNVDGLPYCLVKLNHNFEILNEIPFKHIKRWKLVKSSNIVQLHDCFTSLAFGDSSQLIFAYDYYPNSFNLIEYHKNQFSTKNEPITEDLLWCYLIQICSAVSAIHSKNLAARSALNLSKIIVTSKNRIRLSGCGISDVINYELDENKSDEMGLQQYRKSLQRNDFKLIGKIILELCCLTIIKKPEDDLNKILITLKKTSNIPFSDEFIEVLKILNNDDFTDFDLNSFISTHLSHQMLKTINNLQDSNDYTESQLCSELENARLFRLLTKLNFIIDRPEVDEWQENTGKYIIKLFRDYLFCQYNEVGKPVVDLSRVLTNLNKLDAGLDEKFLLISRDEKNCIIVSYKEIRDIVETIFRNLTRN